MITSSMRAYFTASGSSIGRTENRAAMYRECLRDAGQCAMLMTPVDCAIHCRGVPPLISTLKFRQWERRVVYTLQLYAHYVC